MCISQCRSRNSSSKLSLSWAALQKWNANPGPWNSALAGSSLLTWHCERKAEDLLRAMSRRSRSSAARNSGPSKIVYTARWKISGEFAPRKHSTAKPLSNSDEGANLLARAQGELTVAVRSAVRRESFVSTRLPDRAVPWHLLGLHEGLARTIYTPSANRGWRSAQWHTSRPGG